ncbi:hypothetical protein BDP27DRAFT_1295498 [Rhodocollybia butyracea]|uniref:Dickkopf N-terminal cysteine-rich domain-containing protein n=1 Tax=Rhodocollybia butyracea TaxID=206335 RepID=A0A9P5PLR6_9AGAR|nr:hypothetical protein BDP27DRAFT_1295498 [Rhodocollybia butyracea]
MFSDCRSLIFWIAFSSLAYAGSSGLGQPCSVSRNHLDPNSHKLISDCSELGYCSGSVNGTCVPRTCRRDEFPFGYTAADALPPLCPPGSFCPDEGNGCRAQVSPGGACQMNRDEQCARAVNWQDFASSDNFYGSICLHSICMYANATTACVIDNTTYTDVGFNGRLFNTVVVRDNCRSPQLYCGQDTLVCERSKVLGSSCQIDQECQERNCLSGLCTEPPETPLHVAPWQYVLTAICIVGAMMSTCLLLTLIHKRHRLKRYRELREYYMEQSTLRSSIVALHSAAAGTGPRLDSKRK